MTMEHVPEGKEVPTSFKLTDEAAQELMNRLWNLGVRPSDGTGNTGQLKATEDHLKDMRKIVSKKLGVDL